VPAEQALHCAHALKYNPAEHGLQSFVAHSCKPSISASTPPVESVPPRRSKFEPNPAIA
jgi:hypothetical protein